MNKKLLFLCLSGFALSSQAQTVNQWMQYQPIPLEKPALSYVKNVDNKVFDNASFLTNSGLNLNMLNTSDQQMWKKASMDADTVTIANTPSALTMGYSIAYMDCDQWIEGNFNLTHFSDLALFIDGKEVYKATTTKKKDTSIAQKLTPGKHTITVKSVSAGNKLFAMSFKPKEEFKTADIRFSTSAKAGLDIYNVLNGNSIRRIDVAPDGKMLLVQLANTEQGNTVQSTAIYDIATKQLLYTFGNNAENIQWLPQQDKVSYLIHQGNTYSLYTYDPISGQQAEIFRNDAAITGVTWSPNEKYLLYFKNYNYDIPNWELKKMQAIQDRQPYYRNRSLIFKYDLATGIHTPLTWGNQTTSLMDISSDGEQLLVSTSRPDYSRFPFSSQNVYRINANTFKTDTLFQDLKYGIDCKFSPDATQLLVSGGASSFGTIGENIKKNQLPNQYDKQLFIYTLDTKEVLPITKNFNPSVDKAIWHRNGTIYFSAIDGEYQRLYQYAENKIEQIATSGDMFLSMTLSNKANCLCYTASHLQYPAQLYTMDITAPTSNKLWMNPVEKQYKNIVFGQVGDWDYQYSKSTLIDGRYYLPLNYEEGKKYPMIVYYYGGTTPVGRNFGGRWPFNMYAAMGYVVYIMQPSGAIGYGQEFSARHQNNWGKITGDEIIKCVKAFTASHPFVDKTKIGCMGASYGGFTTQYLTTRTDIFACAISHAGISSIASYWGDGYWGYGYSTNASGHSYPWNRRDIYVDQSPLFNADKVACPMLLIHGTKDVNVPTSESMQMYTALKLLGKETDLVFVKNADHAVVDYQQRILWSNTIMAYFAKYLKNQPAWWNSIYPDKNL